MKLLIDSGSTKTEWYYDCDTVPIRTAGMNPYHMTPDALDSIIEKAKVELKGIDIRQIRYFGAGIDNNKTKKQLESSLFRHFTSATHIEVANDIELAAFCTEENCHVGILGTGSNSVMLKEGKLLHTLPAMGYLLGDEGSGNDLGRRFLRHYAYGTLPNDIQESFVECYNLSIHRIKDELYGSASLKNQYLASFAPFLSKHQNHAFIASMIKESFFNFLEQRIINFKDIGGSKILFIGSIAYHFSEILKEACRAYSLDILKIIRQPGEYAFRSKIMFDDI